MNFYIDASNIHSGGGKTILNDFLSGAVSFPEINFFIWIDDRYHLPHSVKGNKNLKFFNTSKLARIFIQFSIRNLSKNEDIIIFFGNLPPLIKFRTKTYLFQSNRYLIQNYSTKGMPINTRLRINIERSFFYLFKKNVDEIIVQSDSMKFILDKTSPKLKTTVKPFKDFNEKLPRRNNFDKNRFIYIASDEPHKNHQNLISAWVLLSKEGIYPNLILTINKGSNVFESVITTKKEYNLNIDILSNISREDLMKEFSKCDALIFPSFFESYGLPIVEAKIMGMDVIASELDFVRDMIDPIETFDPFSPLSITRAIKRYIKHKDSKTDIIAPTEIIKYLKG